MDYNRELYRDVTGKYTTKFDLVMYLIQSVSETEKSFIFFKDQETVDDFFEYISEEYEDELDVFVDKPLYISPYTSELQLLGQRGDTAILVDDDYAFKSVGRIRNEYIIVNHFGYFSEIDNIYIVDNLDDDLEEERQRAIEEEMRREEVEADLDELDDEACKLAEQRAHLDSSLVDMNSAIDNYRLYDLEIPSQLWEAHGRIVRELHRVEMQITVIDNTMTELENSL